MTRTLMVLFASLFLIAGACGGEETPSSEESGESADALPVTVTAKDFAFDRDTVEAHATHTVDLTFVNEDDVAHTFTIDELEVDVEAAGGAEETTTFTPEELGSFEYYCKFHPDTMKGELTVE